MLKTGGKSFRILVTLQCMLVILLSYEQNSTNQALKTQENIIILNNLRLQNIIVYICKYKKNRYKNKFEYKKHIISWNS